MSFLFRSLFSLRDLKELVLLKKNKEQVKGRHYEINGSGGFQLSYFVPGLNLVYEIDREIAVYENVRNMPGEINFFLQNEDIRNSIANKGYERSLKEHTAQKYLENLINKVMSR